MQNSSFRKLTETYNINKFCKNDSLRMLFKYLIQFSHLKSVHIQDVPFYGWPNQQLFPELLVFTYSTKENTQK